MQQYQSAGQVDNQQSSNDAVNRLLRQAEISRLTRNLKNKLAMASLKTQASPESARTTPDGRRRSKTLEGAISSPRPVDTPIASRTRSGSRRASITSMSSISSIESPHSVASPRARIPRIGSVNSIAEERFDDATAKSQDQFPTPRSRPGSMQFTPQQINGAPKQQPQHQKPQQSRMQHVNAPLSPYDQPQFQQQVQQQVQQRIQIQHPQQQQQQRLEDSLRGPVQLPSSVFDSPGLLGPASYNTPEKEPFKTKNKSATKSATKVEFEEPKLGSGFDETPVKSNNFEVVSTPKLNLTPMFRGEDETLPQEPKTPPPSRHSYPKTPDRALAPSASDGANLLLHFAQSPGRGTPRTPDFNMSDYLHFQTPSPARGGQLTPHRLRWGSLNTSLFGQAGSLGVTAIPDLLHPAGSGVDRQERSM